MHSRSPLQRRLSFAGKRLLYGKKEAFAVDELLSANASVAKLWFRVVVGVIVIVAIAYAIVMLPEAHLAYVQRAYHAALPIKEYVELENASRGIVLQALGGIAVFLTLYFSLRNVAISEVNAKTALEGQITDRFTKAIEKLGSEKLEMRLGGIYALERIAHDSERDHWPIMEVLTAFVRENAPWDGAAEGQADANGGTAKLPRTDIKAVMTVLKRRRWQCERSSHRLDLSSADLRQVDLSGAYLRRADFSGACLTDALLNGADMEKANFASAVLTRASLDGSFLQEANFEKATLVETSLMRVKADGANFFNASLPLSCAIGASLKLACFRGADLERADYGGASLQHANLMGTRLQGISLHRAHLEWAKLDGADAEGVDFGDTYLQSDLPAVSDTTVVVSDNETAAIPSQKAAQP